MIDEQSFENMALYVNKASSRIMMLEEESNKLLNEVIDRNESLLSFKSFFHKEISEITMQLLECKHDLDFSKKRISNVIEEFKSVLKIEKFKQLQDTVDVIPFEFFLTRKEVERIVK